jgi:hypothetical protein
MPSPKLLYLLSVCCLLGCEEGPTPPVVPQPKIELGPGLTNLLPHQQEGTAFPLAVLVTVNGEPAKGVEVMWYDGRTPTYLSTRRSETDADGIARATWTLPYLAPAVPWTSLWAEAALPGASGNPVEFSIEVFRCTKC